MLSRWGIGISFRAYYHRQYKYVDGLLAANASISAQCKCYYEDMNINLPKDKQLDSAIDLPNQVPSYRKHLLVVSPPDRSPKELQWKTAWQSKLELNTEWPYSVISKLKEHLKHAKSGSDVLVNAVAMVSGDIKPLEATDDRIAHIMVLPDNRLYAIHERQIEEFAHCVGGGKVEELMGKKPSFNDYLRGADNAQLPSSAESLVSLESEGQNFDYETSAKDWILVCGHYQRDERCGLVGQDLIKEIQDKGLGLDKNIGLVSHIGGHKYAGNVILYTKPSSKDVVGEHLLDCLWFGKVLPPNISLLLENLEKGLIPKELYRGGMAME